MKAYKAFNSDWTCRDFQYEVGKTYVSNEPPKLCEQGFHACINPIDCFDYYSFTPDTKFSEVELSGEIDGPEADCSKVASSIITIVRELPWSETLQLINSGAANTGKRNSGDQNSGNQNSGNQNSGDQNSGDLNSGRWNSGNRNSGHWNSGNRNSGHRNSGHWNSGHWNSGHLNSKTPDTILVFNKTCARELWEAAKIPGLLHFELTQWVPLSTMTPDDLQEHPNAKTNKGYLKTLTYEEAWRQSWNNAPDTDKQLLYKLPNFDSEVFEEISGIDVTKDPTWPPE